MCIGTFEGTSAELHVSQKIFFTPTAKNEAFRYQEGITLLRRNKRGASSICHSIQHLFNTASFQSNSTRECPMKIDRKHRAKIPHEETP